MRNLGLSVTNTQFLLLSAQAAAVRYQMDSQNPAAVISIPRGDYLLDSGAGIQFSSIGALLSFSSAAKYTVGPDGNYILNAANSPAWDWSTGRRRLLIEAIPTTNLNTWSQDLTYWGSGGTTSIASVASTAPDGAANCQKIIPTASSGSLFYRQANAYTLAASTNYVKWGIFKPDGYNIVVGQSRKLDGTWLYAHFNIATGAVTNISAGVTAWTVLLKGGWYLVVMSFNSGTGATPQNDAWYVSNAAGFPTFTPDGTSGVLHWQSQYEVGTTPTSPVVSGASPTARAGDIVTAASGLLAPLNTTGASFSLAMRGKLTAPQRSSILGPGNRYASVLLYSGAYLDLADNAGHGLLCAPGSGDLFTGDFGVAASSIVGGLIRKASANGSAVVSDNYTLFDGSETSMVIGGGNINFPANMLLDELIVWPTLASNAGLQAQARVYS